ncbi:uncharacterized protein MELLADRAFT_113789 [Melampsora larici-populina 98AG31]|uniref:Uncharacterized protein n=1 Tax=Melampsora larici-populina (strain 98AG31 / pathotype 3-4-7) TaxID=747676 RepID=F4SB25_MELLP|nr:uncharacterized protein MELLADRAFT_113789 [Melampsora larici-populina 98AG31]EGF98157.1 hypothetical protein MELLADRAFT_113789 [Melampsora larici-populina 98AG31]
MSSPLPTPSSKSNRARSPEITWLGSTSGTQFTPQEFLCYRSFLEEANHVLEEPDHIVPHLADDAGENQNATAEGKQQNFIARKQDADCDAKVARPRSPSIKIVASNIESWYESMKSC